MGVRDTGMLGFDGIKMYGMVDGFVLFIFFRSMTDIRYCCVHGVFQSNNLGKIDKDPRSNRGSSNHQVKITDIFAESLTQKPTETFR